MDEFDLDTIEPLSDAIIERSEQALRAGDRALPGRRVRERVLERRLRGADRPQGEGDRQGRRPDHRPHRSSPQSRYGINSVLNYTHAYTSFAVKAAICPEVPHNEGCVPAGPRRTRRRATILNPKHPAPVAARHIDRPLPAEPDLRGAGEGDAGPADGRGRRLTLGHRLPGRAAERADLQPDDLPVRRHGRPPDQGRPEQRRLPERRGRRAGRGDREPDGDGAGAPRDQAGLGRPGHVPGRLRPVHDVPDHQRPAVVDGRDARSHEVPRQGVPGRRGRCDRRVLPDQRRAPEPEGVPAARAGRLGDAGATGRRRLLRGVRRAIRRRSSRT